MIVRGRRPAAAWPVTAAVVLLASVGASSAPPVGGIAATGLSERIVLNPLAEISLESLTGFRDRPLFVPSRRPPPPPVVEVEPEPEPDVFVEQPSEPEAEPEAPNVALSGILEIGEEAVAVLRDADAESTLSVRVGDDVGDWTVAAIGEDSIKLDLDGVEHEIKIFQPGPSEVAPRPSAVLGHLRGADDGSNRPDLPRGLLRAGGVPAGRVVGVPADPLSAAPGNDDTDEDSFDEEDDSDYYGDSEDDPIDAASDDSDYLLDAADEDMEDDDADE